MVIKSYLLLLLVNLPKLCYRILLKVHYYNAAVVVCVDFCIARLCKSCASFWSVKYWLRRRSIYLHPRPIFLIWLLSSVDLRVTPNKTRFDILIFFLSPLNPLNLHRTNLLCMSCADNPPLLAIYLQKKEFFLSKMR